MPDLAQLLQYAHKVKLQYEKRTAFVKQEMQQLVQAWQGIPQAELPVVNFAIPVIKNLDHLAYTIVGADSSPLQLSRHRSVELRALSLSRVFTDYQQGIERVKNDILDFPEQDELAALKFPLLELEFATQETEKGDLLLVDGSLIRWQWEEWNPEKKLHYVGQYVDLLVQCYKQQSPVFAVIDRSTSRDIVHWLELKVGKKFAQFTDQDLFLATLENHAFSPVFRTHSPITDLLPEYNIGFTYYKHEQNLLRIEFVLEQEIATQAWTCLVDQVNKGKGYPWSLIRAHEACVVREADKAVLEQILGGGQGISQKEMWKQTL